MDKKLVGKYAGLTGAVALILTIICQITHNGGLPWLFALIVIILRKYTIKNVGMFVILKVLALVFANAMISNEKKLT